MKIIHKLFMPIFLDPKSAIKVFVNGLADTFLLSVIPLVFIPKIIGFISTGDFLYAKYFALVAFVLFLLIIFLKAVFMTYWYWAMNIVFETVIYKKYLPDIFLINSEVFEKSGTGYHLSKFNSGVHALASNSRQMMQNLPSIALGLLLGLYFTFNLGVYFFIFFCFFVIVMTLLILKIYKKEVEMNKPAVEMYNRLSENVARIIMSRQEVIYSDKTKLEVEGILGLQDKRFKIEKKAYRYSMRRFVFIWPAATFVLIGVFVLQSFGIINLSASELTLVILLGNTIADIIFNIFGIVGSIFENYNSIQAFWEMIEEPKMKNYKVGNSFIHKGGEIEFKNVSFKYSESEDEESGLLLKDFDLKINKGERLALVGRSGSGKTTLARLISGYLLANTGDVLVDGQNLKDIALVSYYENVGYLTQEPMVFDGTIRENLLYSVRNKVSDEKLREILDLSHCQFILKMKNGLDTKIGERGVRLSGGERQRLAIAKLMLKNPEIIILDEPTSALDSFSEDAVTKALESLFSGKTVIIIAHRLQTVKSADRILVMDSGKVVESGNHQELVHLNGKYAQMLAMQSGF